MDTAFNKGKRRTHMLAVGGKDRNDLDAILSLRLLSCYLVVIGLVANQIKSDC
jgi:hypothetical protein